MSRFNIAQVAIEYLKRQSSTWDMPDAEQLIEMAGPICCPPIRIRARLSHEARADHLRRASHMAMAFGFPEHAIRNWLHLPVDIQERALKAIETAERAGVKVTGEMIKAWVKILKEEK